MVYSSSEVNANDVCILRSILSDALVNHATIYTCVSNNETSSFANCILGAPCIRIRLCGELNARLRLMLSNEFGLRFEILLVKSVEIFFDVFFTFV